MEERCSFSKLVGDPCGLDNPYPLNTDITQLVSCKRDIAPHTSKFGAIDNYLHGDRYDFSTCYSRNHRIWSS